MTGDPQLCSYCGRATGPFCVECNLDGKDKYDIHQTSST